MTEEGYRALLSFPWATRLGRPLPMGLARLLFETSAIPGRAGT